MFSMKRNTCASKRAFLDTSVYLVELLKALGLGRACDALGLAGLSVRLLLGASHELEVLGAELAADRLQVAHLS